MAQSTPRKQHIVTDKCALCSFSFCNIEITSSGETFKNTTYLNRKLKLTVEKIEDLKVILGVRDFVPTETGICIKCYRKVESVKKTEKELQKTKQTIFDSFLLSSSNREVVVKRLAESPSKGVKKVFSPSIMHRTKLNTSEMQSKQTFKRSNTLQLIEDCPCILPCDVKPSVIPLVCTETDGAGHQDRCTTTKATQSLFSSEKTSIIGNKVQITIYYDSGVKTALVTNAAYIKMCKAIFTNENVEKKLLTILKSTCPEDVVSCAASIIQSECASICKRKSAFVLNDKSYNGIMQFSWDTLHQQLLLGAPNTLRIVSSMASIDIPMSVPSKEFHHVLFAIGIALHARNREMTTLQYLNGMVLLHGGCTQRDVERLAKLGICVVPQTVSDKLQSWQENLDNDLLEVKNKWITGGNRTYQLVGDNWDKNIIPSYRTSQQETQSLHLFNVIGVIDRIVVEKNDSTSVKAVESLSAADFIPSVNDLELLRDELTFIVARSLIENNEQMRKTLGNLYPDHLKHCYSDYAGMKTSQCSLGLFDCDEKKTQDVIQLLKLLSEKFVPKEGEEIIEEVFFGGDRLTDERIQLAQKAMSNADSGLERLEGFISKIEDFHRLMNFLEAIHRTTYNTESSRDRGTIYYYRNFLNARNVKGEVKNSYRAYKHLYYTVFDAMCCVLFLNNFGLDSAESEIPLPKDFDGWTNECKINWINSVCRNLVNKAFFEDDMFMELREILTNPDHEENYWISSLENDRFKCHFCNSSYSYVDSLKAHEKNKHGFQPCKQNSDKTLKKEASDELHDYVLSLFRLTALHKNLDSAVDMGDGYRVVRSAKYETPIYNKTHKIKYLIGSVHLTAMVSGTLPVHQTKRLIANRFINISGGKNSNISLDEYVEILNRDTKNTCSGFQTKESIIKHSKEFPHLINAVKHVDDICNIRGRKGYHKLPSYRDDVKRVVADLLSVHAFTDHQDRKLVCRKLVQANNPFKDCYKGLSEMIVRHRPVLPFRRLRNKHL